MSTETIFSNSFVNFEIYGIKKNSGSYEFSYIDDPNLVMNSLITLEFNNTSKNKAIDSVCVQIPYSNSSFVFQDYSLCETWLNDDNIFCSCNNQGTTLNIVDNRIAKLSRMLQFPGVGQSASKKL